MSTTNQKKNQSNSYLLKNQLEKANLNQNTPENQTTNLQYLEQRQQEQDRRNQEQLQYEQQQQNAPNVQDQADRIHSQSKQVKRGKVLNESDARKRQLKMNELSASKGYMAASMGASYVKQAGRTAENMGLGSVGGALLGSTGGFYQGGMKSISNAGRVNKRMEMAKHAKELGATGTTKRATSLINDTMRMSYSANLMKGLMGGQIAPTSSMKGSMVGGINSMFGAGGGAPVAIASAAGPGAGQAGIGSAIAGAGNAAATGAGSMISPGMAATVGLAALSMGSSMAANKKLRKLMVTKKTPGELERKYAKGSNLDSFYKSLRAQEQITPQQQLQYILLSYIEGHTSVLPELLSLNQQTSEGKDKAGKQLDGKYTKQTGISDDPDVLKHDSLLTTLENTLNLMITKYDPISQLTSFILTGSTPKKILEDIEKGKGLSKKELSEKDDSAHRLGISTDQFRLLGINSASLIAGLPSYEVKMLALASASYDMNRLIAQESATIRKHGLGVDHNSFNSPISKTGLFGKLENVVNLIPGLSAGYNVIKDTLLLPKKGAEFMKGLFKGGMNTIFGKDFLRHKDQKELDKDLGFDKSAQVKATEYTAEGLPTHMEKVRTLAAQQLDIQYNIFDVLTKQYNLTHEQTTGKKSEYGYTQKMDNDVLQERTWDSFEQKMLTGEGLEKALEKRQVMYQLQRDKDFKKSGINKLTMAGTLGLAGLVNIDRKQSLVDKITPGSIDTKKEKEQNIRSTIKDDTHVKEVDLETERKRATADVTKEIMLPLMSAMGLLTAVATGGVSAIVAGGGATALGSGVGGLLEINNENRRDKLLSELEEKNLGREAIEGRGITSIDDETKKRSNLANKTTSASSMGLSSPTLTSIIDKDKIVPDKIQVLHEMIDDRFGEVVDLFISPIQVENLSILSRLTAIKDRLTSPIGVDIKSFTSSLVRPIKKGFDRVVSKLNSKLKVDVKSNVFGDYKLKIPKDSSSILPGSGAADSYAEIKAAAGGGVLVGENGPEYIKDNKYVYNADQAKSKLGLDLHSLASDPNVRKLAGGGTLPSADDLKSAEAKPENNVVSIASKMKEDKEEKKYTEEQKIQNKILSNSDETYKLLTDIEKNTRKKNEKKKDGIFSKVLAGLAALLSGGGLAALLTGGAALAAFFGTGGKVGTKAVAGIAGRMMTKILAGIGKIFKKSGPELLETIFEKIGKNFTKMWPTALKALGVGKGFFTDLITHSWSFVKSGIKKLMPDMFDNIGAKLAGLGGKAAKIFKKLPGSTGIFKKLGSGLLEKIGLKGVAKMGMKGAGKLISKLIPGLGLLVGGYFAVQRALKGEWLEAAVELGSGIASLVPGFGTALSLSADVWLAFRDSKKETVVDGGPGSRTGAKKEKVDGPGLLNKMGTFITEGFAKVGNWILDKVYATPFIGGFIESFVTGVKNTFFDVVDTVKDATVEDGKLKPDWLGSLATTIWDGFGEFKDKIFEGIYKLPIIGGAIKSLITGVDNVMFATTEFAKDIGKSVDGGQFKPGWMSRLWTTVSEGFGKVKTVILGEIYKLPVIGGVIKSLVTGTENVMFATTELVKGIGSAVDDGQFKPGWPGRLWTTVKEGFGNVKDAIFDGIYKLPFIGSFIESSVTGVKNTFFATQDFVNETNEKISNFSISDTFHSIKDSLVTKSSDFFGKIPFIGSYLKDRILGKETNIQETLTNIKTEVNNKAKNFSVSDTFTNIKEKYIEFAATMFNSVPIIGSFIKNFIMGKDTNLQEELKLANIDAKDTAKSFSITNTFTNIKEKYIEIYTTLFKSIPIIGSFISNFLIGKETNVQEELKLANIDAKDTAKNFSISDTFHSIKLLVIEKAAGFFGKIPLIGSWLSNGMLGLDPSFKNELDQIKLDQVKQSPQFKLADILNDMISGIRKAAAIKASSIPLVGAVIANKLYPEGDFDEDTEIVDGKIVSEPKSLSKIAPKNILKKLENRGVVDINNMILGDRSTIADNQWDTISELSTPQLQSVIDYDDWSKTTKDRLLEIQKSKETTRSNVVTAPKTEKEVLPVKTKQIPVSVPRGPGAMSLPEVNHPVISNPVSTKKVLQTKSVPGPPDRSFARGGILPEGLSLIGEGSSGKISEHAEAAFTGVNPRSGKEKTTIFPAELTSRMGITNENMSSIFGDTSNIHDNYEFISDIAELAGTGVNYIGKSKSVAKELSSKIVNMFSKRGLKMFGKKVPGLGALIGIYSAYEKFQEGDNVGAMMEIASGLTSFLPIIGTAAGTAIDIASMVRESKRASNEAEITSGGAIPAFEKGGKLKPGLNIVGEKGPEAAYVDPKKKDVQIYNAGQAQSKFGIDVNDSNPSVAKFADGQESNNRHNNLSTNFNSLLDIRSKLEQSKTELSDMEIEFPSKQVERSDDWSRWTETVFDDPKIDKRYDKLRGSIHDYNKSYKIKLNRLFKLDPNPPKSYSELSGYSLYPNEMKIFDEQFGKFDLFNNQQQQWFKTTLFDLRKQRFSELVKNEETQLPTLDESGVVSAPKTQEEVQSVPQSRAGARKRLIDKRKAALMKLMPKSTLKPGESGTSSFEGTVYKQPGQTDFDMTKVQPDTTISSKPTWTSSRGIPDLSFLHDESSTNYDSSVIGNSMHPTQPNAPGAYDTVKDVAGKGFDTAKILGTSAYDKAKDLGSKAKDSIVANAPGAYDTVKDVAGKGFDTAKILGTSAYDKAKGLISGDDSTSSEIPVIGNAMHPTQPNAVGHAMHPTQPKKFKGKFDAMSFAGSFASQLTGLLGRAGKMAAKFAIGGVLGEDTYDKVASVLSGDDKKPIKPDTDNLDSPIWDVVKNHTMASEGIVLHKYKDHLGYDTIGVGHLIKKGERFPDKISSGEARTIFNKDFREHKMMTSRMPGFDKLDDVHQGAIVDMGFNLGFGSEAKGTGLMGFKNTRKKLVSGDFAGAAGGIRDSKYHKQVPNRAERIAKVVETSDPSYFNSDKPQIIARHGAFTGKGISEMLSSKKTMLADKANQMFSNVSSKIEDGARGLGFTGKGTAPISATLHPNEFVFGKGQFEGLMSKIVDDTNAQIGKNLDLKRMDISNILSKAKEFEKVQNENIKETAKKETDIQTKAANPAPPVIVNNNNNTQAAPPQNNRQEAEGQFTEIDNSLDKMVYNLFNASTNSLITFINDSVFSNNASFDF